MSFSVLASLVSFSVWSSFLDSFSLFVLPVVSSFSVWPLSIFSFIVRFRLSFCFFEEAILQGKINKMFENDKTLSPKKKKKKKKHEMRGGGSFFLS